MSPAVSIEYGTDQLNAECGPRCTVEEWRVIPGSDGLYCASNLGRIRSEPTAMQHAGRQRGRILTCCRDTKGYPQFQMYMLDGRKIRMKVHRAVAITFLGQRPASAQINHISGDKSDNRVTNLEYVSCRENIRHGWAMGLFRAEHCRGEANCGAKLTTQDVKQIRALHPGLTLSQLAGLFGVTKENISQIVRRRTWKHVA